MMSYAEWNHTDELWVALYFPVNPVASNQEGLNTVLGVIEQEAGFLAPDRVLGRRHYRYTRQRAREELARSAFEGTSWLPLQRKKEPEAYWSLSLTAMALASTCASSLQRDARLHHPGG